jgi:hypothetical protein
VADPTFRSHRDTGVSTAVRTPLHHILAEWTYS